MKNDRKFQPVKADYVEALGMAAFCFASCEWNVVWCCEKICPGSLAKIVSEEMTAGKIAKYFIDVSRNMPASNGRQELEKAAGSFKHLVTERNNIFHAKPCTGPNGDSRLSGKGVVEIGDLEDAADSFTACGQVLNSLLHGFLEAYEPP